MSKGILEADLQREHYDYFVDISTRWMDNDVYGHVNNVTYYSYFDTAANQYLIQQGGLDIHNAPVVGLVVASQCQYRSPIAHPQQLEVAVRANNIGNSSVEYGLAVFIKGCDTASACGRFTHVFVERDGQQVVPIPAPIRSALRAIERPAQK